MRVVFRTNLGSADAKKIMLEDRLSECTVGSTVDVPKAAADKLLAAGIVCSVEDAKTDALIQSALGVPDETITA